MSWFNRLILSPPRCQNLGQLRAKVGGKTVLITGATFGIGEAASLLLTEAGAEVVLVARTEEKLQQLVEQIRSKGGKASAYTADLYKVDEMPTLAQQILANHSRIDIVLSNAGKSIQRSILHSAERNDLGRLLALNFSSPAALILALLPGMIEQGGGQIINVSSAAAKLPSAPRWAGYQASKTGFEIWLRGLANELRQKKIYASTIYLPLVRTRMIAPTKMYDRMPALSPLEAAQCIAYAIVKPVDRVAPWWLWWAELLSVLFITPINRMLSWMEQRSK